MKEIYASDENLSIVVQGLPCKETLSYLKKLRQLFDRAELILSTWVGVDAKIFEGVVDKVILNDDPGAAPFYFSKEKSVLNNVNRQIVSTVSGLKASSRPLVMKVRTDFVLSNRSILEYWGKYPRRTEKYSLFENRIIISSIFSCLYAPKTFIPQPFFVSDFFAFGLREDLLLLYGSAPLANEEELGAWRFKFPQLVPVVGLRCRYAPEQMIFLHAAKKKFTEIFFDDWTDICERTIVLSNHLLMNNFIFLDPAQIGLESNKHRNNLDRANRGEIEGLLYNKTFEMRYCDLFYDKWEVYEKLPDSIQLREIESEDDGGEGRVRLKLQKHRNRLKVCTKSFVQAFGVFWEPFVIAYYWARTKFKI